METASDIPAREDDDRGGERLSCGGSERLARDPLAQQRVDDDVAARLRARSVLADQRGERGLHGRRAAEPVPRARTSADSSPPPSSSTTARSTARCASVSRCQTASNIVCCSASSRLQRRCRSSSVARRLAAAPRAPRPRSRAPAAARRRAGCRRDRRWRRRARPPACMPDRANRASMKAANSSAGNLLQPHHRPGLVERPLRSEHPLHQARLRSGEHVADLALVLHGGAQRVLDRPAVEAADRLELVERDDRPCGRASRRAAPAARTPPAPAARCRDRCGRRETTRRPRRAATRPARSGPRRAPSAPPRAARSARGPAWSSAATSARA